MSNLTDFIGGSGGSSIPLNEDVFTSNGTWVCPSKVFSVIIDATGAGGANSNGGGGSSRFTGQIVKVTPGLSYDVTIGAAPGGNTTLKETVSATVVFTAVGGGSGTATVSHYYGSGGYLREHGTGGKAGSGGIPGSNTGSILGGVMANNSGYAYAYGNQPKNGASATGSYYKGVEYGGAGLNGIMIIRY